MFGAQVSVLGAWHLHTEGNSWTTDPSLTLTCLDYIDTAAAIMG